MDAVKAFNNELSALYEVKPPISKAKMSSITRSAIKAIKFYKHVVQSVEKFIQKCKPEYKVPGLYVIDSIVRQSRHQFGPDKDLFAPRFAKNMQNTFANLFSCPPEDKGKIIRVLNLWQKNSVFTPDVIQPLFDQLADPNNPIHRENVAASNGLNAAGDHTSPKSGSKKSLQSEVGTPHWVKMAQSQIDAANKAIYEITGTNLSQSKSSSNSSLDILQQIQQLQQFILNQTNQASQKQDRSQSDQVVFDKKLLDFDYDDDDEENTSPHQQSNNNDNFNNILQNPEILRQLTALQQQMSQHQLRQQQLEVEEKMRKLKEMKQQEEEFDKHLAQTVPKLPFASECDLKQYQEAGLPDLSIPPPGYPKQSHRTDTHDSEIECIDDDGNDRNVEVINLLDRSPSTSPSQTSSRRRHSRSRSRDRRRSRRSRSRTSRSRSRSLRGRRRRRSRSRSRDRVYDSEKDRERRKKGLPPIKRNHLSVCSTTLWVGHLSKLVQQEELSDTFGEFGDIVSIDVIPPRGCAFICMNRRQDAARALTRLKDHKLHGKNIMLAWAPGKGVKGRDYKDYWEIDLGVSYIPWNRLSKKTDFVSLEEGGSLDEDTMPESLKETILNQLQKRKDEIEAENKMKNMAAAGYIPLPEGIPAPPVPPVLAAGIPAVMTVPPPVLAASNSPATPAIDTSQPPPNMSPSSKGVPVLSNPSLALPQITPRIPVMAKPGLMMPPFQFTSLPPPLSLGVPNMMSNLPIGVPPPSMQGLLMQQQMMAAIPTSGASPFPPGTILPTMTVPGGGQPSDKIPGSGDVGYDRHPLQGQPIGMANHKEDDSMDLEEEGDDEKSKAAKARAAEGHDKSSDDRIRDDKRDDRNRERNDRDKDRRDRDRDRDRGRERDKDRDHRERERDYRDRDRDKRRNRSRERDDRSRGRERGYRDRSRERDGRRDRSRSDRDRSRERARDKDENEGREDGKREDGKKEPVNQWVEVPMANEEKPSLLQRLRNIAEGGDPSQRPDQMGQMFGAPPPRMPDPAGNRQGPPIVINLNNPGIPRPGFGPRGPMLDVFRPEFGPRGPMDFGPRGFGPGDGMSSNDPGFDPRGRGPMNPDSSDRNRSRFDPGGPRPLMETHFDGPPLIADDIRGPMMHDGMRGPIMHPDEMMCPDDMRGGPMFMDPMDDPRMRFGPRGLMGPMPRGPMGPPHGPGPVPLFGPRGPRPLLGRPNMWMDNQGPPPPHGDNFIRPPFDRRGPGPIGPGPRFRGERPREPRQSRWSKEDAKDSRSDSDKKSIDDEERSENIEPIRDTQTPCHDEKLIEESTEQLPVQQSQNQKHQLPEREGQEEVKQVEQKQHSPEHQIQQRYDQQKLLLENQQPLEEQQQFLEDQEHQQDYQEEQKEQQFLQEEEHRQNREKQFLQEDQRREDQEQEFLEQEERRKEQQQQFLEQEDRRQEQQQFLLEEERRKEQRQFLQEEERLQEEQQQFVQEERRQEQHQQFLQEQEQRQELQEQQHEHFLREQERLEDLQQQQEHFLQEQTHHEMLQDQQEEMMHEDHQAQRHTFVRQEQQHLETQSHFEENENMICQQTDEPMVQETFNDQSQPPTNYERDVGTPCHDEPEEPNIVSENPEAEKSEL